MAPASFIPGYKNLITETLYQKQVDYPFVSNIKTNVYAKDNVDIVRENDSAFVSAYHHQYKADVPYKGAIFTPSILPTRSSAIRQCNPLVAYPYGIPQGYEKEKCTKCKGDKKCHKKRRNRHKTNKQCIEMESNLKENDNKELSNIESKTKDDNIEMKESKIDDLTQEKIKISQFLNVIEDSTYAKSIDFNSNALPSSNNFQEIYLNNVGICEENIGAIITSNDIECFVHLHSPSIYEKDNKQILNESFIDNLNSLNNYNSNHSAHKEIHNDNANYIDIKKVNFTNEKDLNNFNDSTSENDMNFNGTMNNEDRISHLNDDSENNNSQCNVYDYSHNIETENNVDDHYDLDFNPFTNESYNTNKKCNTSDNVEQNDIVENNIIEDNHSTNSTLESESREIISILKEKNSVNFFFNKQEENDENDESEKVQNKMCYIDNNNDNNKNKKQSQDFEEKNIGKIDMENEINGKENLTKKIIKKKKNNTNIDIKSLNKIKKIDDKLNKYAKHSYTHFEPQKKAGQKRVCKMEDVIGQIIKNEAELKASVDLKSKYRISMTNTDDAFPLSSVRSLRSAKKLSDKKKILPFKNPNHKELKSGLVPQIIIPKNLSFNSKKYGKNPSNNKLVKSNTKNINAFTNKKKKTIIGKITNGNGIGNITKKINTPLLLKKKSKIQDLMKKNVNKTEVEESTGNVFEVRENNELEKEEEEEKEKAEEEGTEDEEEDAEDEEGGTLRRKLLFSRSATKFYGNKKSVPFRDVQVKRYTKPIIEPAKQKETTKSKNVDLSDKKKKLETKKSKKVIVIGPDTTSKSYRKVTIAGKLRSKKKELYTNILNLTQNIKPKEPVEDIKKKRESKEKIQTTPKLKKMI